MNEQRDHAGKSEASIVRICERRSFYQFCTLIFLPSIVLIRCRRLAQSFYRSRLITTVTRKRYQAPARSGQRGRPVLSASVNSLAMTLAMVFPGAKIFFGSMLVLPMTMVTAIVSRGRGPGKEDAGKKTGAGIGQHDTADDLPAGSAQSIGRLLQRGRHHLDHRPSEGSRIRYDHHREG